MTSEFSKHLNEQLGVFLNMKQQKLSQLKDIKQEVGDDLSVCMMNILPKFSSLPSLLAINLRKMEI